MTTRDPIADPQEGDVFMCYPPGIIVKIYVVHRRAEWVWFGGPTLPIRSARVDHFAQTFLQARAEHMNRLREEDMWPTPKHDDSGDGVPS